MSLDTPISEKPAGDPPPKNICHIEMPYDYTDFDLRRGTNLATFFIPGIDAKFAYTDKTVKVTVKSIYNLVHIFRNIQFMNRPTGSILWQSPPYLQESFNYSWFYVDLNCERIPVAMSVVSMHPLSQLYRLELYKNGELIHSIENIKPKKINGCNIFIVDLSVPSNPVFDGTVSIKPYFNEYKGLLYYTYYYLIKTLENSEFLYD